MQAHLAGYNGMVCSFSALFSIAVVDGIAEMEETKEETAVPACR